LTTLFRFKVADSTWVILREEGAIVEEADDDDDESSVAEEGFDEKDALTEKIGLHLQDIGAGLDIADISDRDD
jgi:hypothetical protein